MKSKEDLTIDAVVPFGPCMRYTYLRQIIFNEIQSLVPNLTEFSLTTNMEEDISIGACRISHLLAENRLCIDDQLKENGVFFYMDNSENKSTPTQRKENEFLITCSQKYAHSDRNSVLGNLNNSDWDKMKESMYFETMIIHI